MTIVVKSGAIQDLSIVLRARLQKGCVHAEDSFAPTDTTQGLRSKSPGDTLKDAVLIDFDFTGAAGVEFFQSVNEGSDEGIVLIRWRTWKYHTPGCFHKLHISGPGPFSWWQAGNMSVRKTLLRGIRARNPGSEVRVV
jgi:hypothetical protein